MNSVANRRIFKLSNFTFLPLAVFLLTAANTGSALAATFPSWTSSVPGIQYTHYEGYFFRQNEIHAVKVDLNNWNNEIHATQESDSGLTVSDFADLYNCEVAINANLFACENCPPYLEENSEEYLSGDDRWYAPREGAVGEGARWERDSTFSGLLDFVGFFAVDNNGDITLERKFFEDNRQSLNPAFENNWENMVASRPILLVDGARTSTVSSGDFFNETIAPRTAIGLSQDKRYLYMAVVDGRQEDSEGLTLYELSVMMEYLGASDALALDGGGSSAMFVRKKGGIVNAPSHEGLQRVVSNHIGICMGKTDSQILQWPYSVSPIDNCGDISVANLTGGTKDELFFNHVSGDLHYVPYTPYLWYTWFLESRDNIPNYSSNYMDTRLVGDFNGDARDDILYIETAPYDIWHIFDGATHTWSIGAKSNIHISRLLVGDFDGDGKDDVFTTSGGKWFISRSARSSWTQINGSSATSQEMIVGDFDGNGVDDIFITREGEWLISWNGHSLYEKVNGSSAPLDALMVGDFDGDGKDDILNIADTMWKVSYSARGRWQALHHMDRVYSQHELRIGEFDGTPSDDVVLVDYPFCIF